MKVEDLEVGLDVWAVMDEPTLFSNEMIIRDKIEHWKTTTVNSSNTNTKTDTDISLIDSEYRWKLDSLFVNFEDAMHCADKRLLKLAQKYQDEMNAINTAWCNCIDLEREQEESD